MKKAWVLGVLVLLVIVACSSPATSSQNQSSTPSPLDEPIAASPTRTSTPEPAPPTPEPATPTPKPAAPPEPVLPPGVISGVVHDAEGPVAGAVVRVRLTEHEATTAADGSFALSDLTMTGPV